MQVRRVMQQSDGCGYGNRDGNGDGTGYGYSNGCGYGEGSPFVCLPGASFGNGDLEENDES